MASYANQGALDYILGSAKQRAREQNSGAAGSSRSYGTPYDDDEPEYRPGGQGGAQQGRQTSRFRSQVQPYQGNQPTQSQQPSASYTNPFTPTSVQQGPSTLSGLMQQGSQNMLVDIGNRWKKNDTVTGLVTGALVDNARTQGNTAAAIAYNSAFLGDMTRYQTALETQRTGNAATLMGVEGNITKDLMGVEGYEGRKTIRAQGSESRKQIAEEGFQNRLGYREQGEQERQNIATRGTQDRLGYVTQGEQERLNIASRGTQDRLGYVTQGEQERLNIASRGVEDRGLERTRGEEARRGFVTQGEQERLNIASRGVEDRAQQDNEARNVIRLRDDARGQIARQGARFYG